MNTADLVWFILVAILSLVFTLIIMPSFIQYFREKQLGQTTRDIGPAWHHQKDGTPTMGGIGFLLASMIAYIIGVVTTNNLTASSWMLLLTLVFFAAIGFIDDYLILILKQNDGISSKQKFIAQILGAGIFLLFYFLSIADVSLWLPLFGEIHSFVIYTVFGVFWINGFSNAVNLTDGLDGLASSTSIVALSTFAVIAYNQANSSVLYFCASLIGGLVAFLYFNKKPAQIFMGDVGSLALGAIMAVLSILLKVEWLLLLIGLPFVVETASVILQVFSFKKFGKRIFKMSPIHHHFEMSGFSEQQVVLAFVIFGIISASLALFIYFN